MGRKFVPQSTIDRRVQAKDDRLNAEIRAFQERHRTPTEKHLAEARTAAWYLADCPPELLTAINVRPVR